MINKALLESCLKEGEPVITVNLLECTTDKKEKVCDFKLNAINTTLHFDHLIFKSLAHGENKIPYPAIFVVICEDGKRYYYDKDFRAKVLAKYGLDEFR
jgi:hypothetical protein